MKRNQLRRPPRARITVDSRDASKDFFIPLTEAKRLHEEGKLDRDLTNGAWTQASEEFLSEIRKLAII